MVTLYVFYELMTLLSVPMVVHERTPQAVAAGIKYLCALDLRRDAGSAGHLLFSNYPGHGDLRRAAWETARRGAPSGLLLITFLVIIGFGTKAGMFPMHGWLPTAHRLRPLRLPPCSRRHHAEAGVLACSA